MVCCVLAIRIMRDGEIERGKGGRRKENRGGPPRPPRKEAPACWVAIQLPAGSHQREAEGYVKASPGLCSLCWAVIFFLGGWGDEY